MARTVVKRNSYFLEDGVRVIERKYSCGLKTREIDNTKVDWYKNLIKTKQNANKKIDHTN
tara:strand:- start:247 stop:426 length:180 start_codon:yes stop_codon:yes gene_type:complete